MITPHQVTDPMTELEHVGVAYQHHRDAYHAQRAVLRAAVIAACDAGMTEQRAAELAGVSRMTVRSWRGK